MNLIAALLVVVALPMGPSPNALTLSHFPDRLHAFVWRNWQITPIDRMAATLGAKPDELLAIGHSMGLAGPQDISDSQWRRSYITVIRANWHLLPYEQLLTLLGWTQQQLAFTLQEDDFLFAKLGSLKPKCEPLRFATPDEAARKRAKEIAAILHEEFPSGVGRTQEPLFHFVRELSSPIDGLKSQAVSDNTQPRYCYSYFALYGDPLLDQSLDPYPDGYLARLRQAGVNGIWIQGVLAKLAPFPWEPALSAEHETRLKNLNRLVARAKQHGIGVYLYLNEPRSMPTAWFESRPELKGAVEGDFAALCTSRPEVQNYLREGVASVIKATPELAGVFTISASENLTSCWSHYSGATCPRCSKRSAAEVIAEVNTLINEGVRRGSDATKFIAWDWGWKDEWSAATIGKLPPNSALMSVSEWSLPIVRGGVASEVGEYSISAVGPGPRALRHWDVARTRGLIRFAKMQVGTTWELGSTPYLPAMNKVAEHATRVRKAKVDGVMLGWTLGGYPSPNLEIASRVLDGEEPAAALSAVAERRFGAAQAKAVRAAWQAFSTAMDEYPYHGSVVYMSPHQVGPANLLWANPTGYKATMVGIPYDDLTRWRGVYPAEVYAAQFAKVAKGFELGISSLREAEKHGGPYQEPLQAERRVAEAAAIQFASAANQARFVLARDSLSTQLDQDAEHETHKELAALLMSEIDLARRLYAIQSADSRIGFEATNHYFFVPMDLAEKVINCRDLLDRWLPQECARRQRSP